MPYILMYSLLCFKHTASGDINGICKYKCQKYLKIFECILSRNPSGQTIFQQCLLSLKSVLKLSFTPTRQCTKRRLDNLFCHLLFRGNL